MAVRKFIPEQIMRALRKSDGNKTASAKLLKCSVGTVNNMLAEFPEIQIELDRILDYRVLMSKPNEKYTEHEVARAIVRARGNLSAAAVWLGCSRKTVHNYVNKYKSVQEAYSESNDIFIDDLENVLYENAVIRKKEASVIFGLKTKGKYRDWGEKLPLKEPDPEPLHVNLPANSIAGSFFDVYRYIREGRYQEYILKGGRGSTKSSFASLIIVESIVNNPEWHVLACRQVQNTLRDSVYSQIRWAIEHLGLTEYFHATLSPLEITYLPTGQKIYFRGADDELKIKSIKPPFGHIAVLWFEELDQFRGAAAVRSVVQSAIRGGENSFIMKSYNPPRSRSNWVNKDIEIPKKNRYVHSSNYLDVPENWLGQVFIDEAEHLEEINLGAYDHEYMGEITGTGGLVFENVIIEEITDEQISQFERPLHGLDWGYFPNPAHYGKCFFDAARLTLYLYGEVRKWKHGNKRFYKAIQKSGLCGPQDFIICDSAEPKSVADFRQYSRELDGPEARGAEKGPESINYSMKWLQSLKAIVIDPIRCPYSTEEFLNYEHEINKDGEYISSYPDKNNDAIDETRYATNRTWARRGQ